MAKFLCPSKISENISETPEGYLLCKSVPIGRTGVMEYGPGETPLEVGEDGIVYVSRTAEELFSKRTIASFEGKSITIRHPSDFVNPHNWKELTKGTLHNVRRGAEKGDDGEEVLLSDLLITEAMGITLVKNGLREVSCGYEAEYEQTGPGRGKQTNIVGNHLALVEQGRAGNSYAIKDHNRKGIMKELLKKALALMSTGKTMDQALAEIEKGSKVKLTKLEKSKGHAKDESVQEGTSSKTPVVHQMPTVDKEAYDELKQMFDALAKKFSDAFTPKEKEENSEDDAVEQEEHEQNGGEDESEEQQGKEDERAAKLEERLNVLEAALKKLLEAKAGDEESEESEDSDEDEESEEAEDEDLEGEEGGKKTGDAALAEILAPGFEAPAKGDIKAAVLKAAMKDEKTATLITQLNGGKAPTFDGKTNLDMLFHASAEVLKARKGTGLNGSKSVDSKPITFDGVDVGSDDMTPEKLNELHEAHWKQQAR